MQTKTEKARKFTTSCSSFLVLPEIKYHIEFFLTPHNNKPIQCFNHKVKVTTYPCINIWCKLYKLQGIMAALLKRHTMSFWFNITDTLFLDDSRPIFVYYFIETLHPRHCMIIGSFYQIAMLIMLINIQETRKFYIILWKIYQGLQLKHH